MKIKIYREPNWLKRKLSPLVMLWHRYEHRVRNFFFFRIPIYDERRVIVGYHEDARGRTWLMLGYLGLNLFMFAGILAGKAVSMDSLPAKIIFAPIWLIFG